MGENRHRDAPIVLLEPNINPITQRFGLPAVANYPPLALVRLAGQIDDPHVRIIDLRIPGEWERFQCQLRTSPPALVGISLTFTSNGEEAIATASAIRQASPDSVIVLGGSGASEEPDGFFDSDVDLIGYRQGDASLAALVRELRKTGRIPEEPPGFFHRSGGRWVLGEDIKTPALGELKPNAWHLVPPRYWKRYFQGYRPTGLGETSSGCPFDCTFCSVWKVYGRRVEVASLANVQHDLRSLPRFVRAFFFADDIWMLASESQLQELYDPLLQWVASDFLPKRRELWFTVETRTDLFLRQEERFRAWSRDGGLQRIVFGLEAVTDEQLDKYHKRTTIDTNSEAIRKAAECGIFVTGQFVIPCDADRAYFDELVRFIDAHREWIRVSNFTIATPLPGTDLYKEVLEEHPELADRKVVTHPAFSLFTALAPMKMAPVEFYEQVARVYKAANQFQFDWTALENLFLVAILSPWLLPTVLKIPWRVGRLTRGEIFMQTHREVQGERLLEARA
jgi:magnesium-protoporphyrin IX monomethyl ester (oxidative) cyclase